MPSVTMNGGILVRAMSRPLTAPATVAASTPPAMPGTSPKATSCIPPSTLTMPSSEPTERSMPPLTMAKVWPIESRASTEDWRATLVRLVQEKKFGLSEPNTRPINKMNAGRATRSHAKGSGRGRTAGATAASPSAVTTRARPRPR